MVAGTDLATDRDWSGIHLPERSFWDVLFEVVLGSIHRPEISDTRVPDQQPASPADVQRRIRGLQQSDANLSTDLDKADEEVRQATPTIRDALAVMSHELRTSLNAMIARTERLFLLLRLRGELTLEQQEEVRRIGQSQVHLQGLIESLLLLIRLEPGQDRYHPTSLRVGDVLHRAEPLIRERTQGRRVHYTEELGDPTITVLADARALYHILTELLTDTIDATPDGGQFTISYAAAGGCVDITITSPQGGSTHGGLQGTADLPLDMDPGFSDTPEGLGLGFAISRGLARAMGGDIKVSEGVTSRAIVTLVLPSSV